MKNPALRPRSKPSRQAKLREELWTKIYIATQNSPFGGSWSADAALRDFDARFACPQSVKKTSGRKRKK